LELVDAYRGQSTTTHYNCFKKTFYIDSSFISITFALCVHILKEEAKSSYLL